ncbi:hypothetical protein X975_02362, partial [Stegodyphus mimosarum]
MIENECPKFIFAGMLSCSTTILRKNISGNMFMQRCHITTMHKQSFFHLLEKEEFYNAVCIMNG